MVEKTRHEPGMFCWVELATSDGEAAKKFYTTLFGWSVKDNPMDVGVYSMLQNNGKDAGGLYQMGPEQAGMPPNWSSYVCVESADETAARAKELGATVRMEPFDVMEHGRMAVIQDPTGAVFSLWQPRSHIGARVVMEPGAFCWNELYTTDPKKAGAFYSELLGWSGEKMPIPSGEYTIFTSGTGGMASGMMAIPKEWAGMPPNWLVYFAVADCEESVEKATSLGASVTVPPMDVPNVGRMSILADPQGAAFAVIKLADPAS